MNAFICIAFKADGKAEILASPDVPYAQQKKLLRSFDNGDYAKIELWSRSSGKIRHKKIRENTDSKKSKKAKTTKPLEKKTDEK